MKPVDLETIADTVTVAAKRHPGVVFVAEHDTTIFQVRATDLAALVAEVKRLRAVAEIIQAAPDPRCDVHPDDGITCGWKATVTRARDALDAGGENDD